MSVATTRAELTELARSFAWDQWSAMGVSGPASPTGNRRAADPEALLLFTFEAARHDPRLFDEVLDWLTLNERHVSVQRLRNLCRDDVDRRLVSAALECVARFRPRQRFVGSRDLGPADARHEPLFYGLSPSALKPDAAFGRHGWSRSEFAPSQKSSLPDVNEPINFAFRLRRLLGIGTRSEIVRTLLTIDAPSVAFGVIEESVAFTRPNVREGILALQEAGVVMAAFANRVDAIRVDRSAWATLLGIEPAALPLHRDWIQLLGALRLILRWVHSPAREGESEYMRASNARELMARIESDLTFAGVATSGHDLKGAAYWQTFESAALNAARMLQS